MAVTGPITGFTISTYNTTASNLYVMGNNNAGQLGNGTVNVYYSSPIQVGSLTIWKQVSSAYHIAAIKYDGTLWTWGQNDSGGLGNGTTISYSSPIQIGSLTNWKQVSVGYDGNNTLAVKIDGTLWAWGVNSQGVLGNNTNVSYSSPIQIGSLTTWAQVVCGLSMASAIKTDGTLWVWGTGGPNMGIGNAFASTSSPVQVGLLTNWKQIQLGYQFAQAIKTDGTLWAWGFNSNYGLGNNTASSTSYSSPIQIGSLTNWSQVSTSPGASHNIAIKTDGTLWAWGYNGFGNLGNGTGTTYSSPIQIGSLTNWSQIEVGDASSSYAIKNDGTFWAWGYNGYGELGNETTLTFLSPVQVGTLNNWISVSAGYEVTAALSGISQIPITPPNYLWSCGYNAYGQLGNLSLTKYSSPIQVGSLTNWSQISTGWNSVAGIKTDGTLWIWGQNNQGQSGQNVGISVIYSSPTQVGSLNNWSQVSLEYQTVAAIKTDGTLWIWGQNDRGQIGNGTVNLPYSSPIQIGLLTNWKQASTGWYHALAIKTDGTLWSSGRGDYGQLGNNASTDYSSPIQVGSLTNWQQVVAGPFHSLAIKTDGTLWSWGLNTQYTLGNGAPSTVNYSSPVQIGSLTNWQQVATNYWHTAAIKTDGTLWTWGYNQFGQIGNGSGVYYSSPTQVGSLNTWSQVACGYYHTAAVKIDGTLWAWGGNSFGELENGTVVYYSSPIQIGSLNTWESVSGGNGTTFAIYNYPNTQDLGQRYVSKDYLLDTYPNIASTLGARKSPGLWGWGGNSFGEIGNGTNSIYSSPIQVSLLTNWKQLAAGKEETAAVKTDGTLWTWGYNNNGQLGNGTVTTYSSPIQVGLLTNWSQVAFGQNYICSIKTNGTLWAWGRNDFGNLGINNIIKYSSPIQVGALTNWKQISCGIGFGTTAAVKTDGSLWTWGYNTNGQLGNGTTTPYSSPIQVGTLTSWKQVSVGSNSMAALKTDGTLWVWGGNSNGELGNNTTVSYSSPIQVGTLTSWKQISSSYHTMAIKTDGSLWTWGYNGNGQLGNGTTTPYSSPIQVGALTNWKQVSVVGNFTAVIKTDGTLWMCGYNGSGVLGNKTTTPYSSPIQVGSLTTWKQVACGYYTINAIADGYF